MLEVLGRNADVDGIGDLKRLTRDARYARIFRLVLFRDRIFDVVRGRLRRRLVLGRGRLGVFSGSDLGLSGGLG